MLLAALWLVIALASRPEGKGSAPVTLRPSPVARPIEPAVTVSERQPEPEARAPNPVEVLPASPPPALVPPKAPPPKGPAKTEPSSPPSLRVRIDLLVTRASRLKGARPELSPALNRIIGEASLWRGAREGPETEVQVKALDAPLAELELRSVTGR